MKKIIFLFLLSLIMSSCTSLEIPPENTIYSQLPKDHAALAEEAYFKWAEKRLEESIFARTSIEELKSNTEFNFKTPFKAYTNDAGLSGGAVNWTGWAMLAEVFTNNKPSIIGFRYTENGVIVDTNNPDFYIHRFIEM